MLYLVRPYAYFENRHRLPFIAGLIAVFLAGGFSYLTVVSSMVLASQLPVDTVISRLGALDVLGATFFISFVWWILVALIFWGVIILSGISTDLLDIFNIAGIGFAPIAIGRFIEMVMTWYLTLNATAQVESVGVELVLSGVFGSGAAFAVLVVRILTLLWAGNIWVAGLSRYGGVSTKQSIGSVFVVLVFLWAYLVGTLL